MCRIFQHEMDHLDGNVIWEESENKRVISVQNTDELSDPEYFAKFQRDHEEHMLMY